MQYILIFDEFPTYTHKSHHTEQCVWTTNLLHIRDVTLDIFAIKSV